MRGDFSGGSPGYRPEREYSDNRIALCFIDGGALKRIRYIDGKCFLTPSNDDFPLLEVNPESNSLIWGVVTYSIKKH